MARLKGFQKLVPVDEALKKFLDSVEFRPKKVPLALRSALNRILAEDIVAGTDLPRTNRSAVDGYAVNAGETVDASQAGPKILKLTASKAIGRKHAKQVWTGNLLPQGADAVVMLENTRTIGDSIEVWNPVTRWENVSMRGEDIQEGKIAVETKTRLKPHDLGMAAALGVVKVEVFKRPKIAILTTGNELAELGSKLQENKIFDSNRLVLSALCTELGAETLDLGIIKDEVNEITERLMVGLGKADAIITSGGTSVGGPDIVPEAVNLLGKPGVIAHGVAMRPGMPTALAIAKNKPIVMLPGNPVAAMLGFEVFGRPLVSRMLGLTEVESRPVLKARMIRKMATTLGRRNLVRVRVFEKNGEFFAEPISARGSGLISTMTESNGYVVVSENLEGLEEGDDVLVHMFDRLEVVEDV